MPYWIGVEKWNRGDFKSSFFSYLPSFGSLLVWGQGGNVVYLLLTVAGGEFGCIPSVPSSLFNVLAGVAHFLAM